MTVKFLTLTAGLVVAALGCASSAPPPAVAQARAPLTKKITPARELRPAGVAQSMQSTFQVPSMIVHHTKEGGIGITGPEKTYLDQTDPSGWSGRSPGAPVGVGGGPTATSDDDE